MLHRGVAHNELISTDVGNRTGKTATSASAPPGTEPRSLDDRRTYLSIDRAFKANLARLTFGLSPAVLAEQTFDWWTHLAISPEKQLQLIEKAFRKATRFGIYAAQSVANPSTPPCISPLPQDRRFQGEAWQHWPYDLIYQSFLLSQQWWHSATTKIDGLSQRNEERLSFTVRQFLDCFSPSNFVWTKSRNRTDDPHAGRSQPRERLPKLHRRLPKISKWHAAHRCRAEHYNLMGPVKAALESAVRYLAYEFGPKGIRVHAISPGPIRTRAASGIDHFDDLLESAAKRAPERSLVSIEDVGAATAVLATDYAKLITGETVYVDAGYHIVGYSHDLDLYQRLAACCR